MDRQLQSICIRGKPATTKCKNQKCTSNLNMCDNSSCQCHNLHKGCPKIILLLQVAKKLQSKIVVLKFFKTAVIQECQQHIKQFQFLKIEIQKSINDNQLILNSEEERVYLLLKQNRYEEVPADFECKDSDAEIQDKINYLEKHKNNASSLIKSGMVKMKMPIEEILRQKIQEQRRHAEYLKRKFQQMENEKKLLQKIRKLEQQLKQKALQKNQMELKILQLQRMLGQSKVQNSDLLQQIRILKQKLEEKINDQKILQQKLLQQEAMLKQQKKMKQIQSLGKKLQLELKEKEKLQKQMLEYNQKLVKKLKEQQKRLQQNKKLELELEQQIRSQGRLQQQASQKIKGKQITLQQQKVKRILQQNRFLKQQLEQKVQQQNDLYKKLQQKQRRLQQSNQLAEKLNKKIQQKKDKEEHILEQNRYMRSNMRLQKYKKQIPVPIFTSRSNFIFSQFLKHEQISVEGNVITKNTNSENFVLALLQPPLSSFKNVANRKVKFRILNSKNRWIFFGVCELKGGRTRRFQSGYKLQDFGEDKALIGASHGRICSHFSKQKDYKQSQIKGIKVDDVIEVGFEFSKSSVVFCNKSTQQTASISILGEIRQALHFCVILKHMDDKVELI